MIQERLKELRTEMGKRGIAVYLIPSADFHESEYVGEYFKERQFITGFTGSAGICVVTMKEAGLWTDGRYFVQAEKQLKDSTIDLYKMGEEGVPTISEFLQKKIQEGETLGFDGRTINAAWGNDLLNLVQKKHGALYTSEDLVGLIWNNRPKMSKEPAFVLDEKYAGKTTKEKINDVREVMKKVGADIHIIASLYDIAWLLNVRGNDIPHVPVVLSFLSITEKECVWFVHKEILNNQLLTYLENNNIVTKPYEEIYEYVEKINAKSVVMVEKKKVNYSLLQHIADSVTIKDIPNPSERMKAIKNPTEIKNSRNAHIKDGVAFTKFMYWIKQNIDKIPLTEIKASDYLAERRKEQKLFLDLSFGTICAYGPNAAMMHYAATPETDAKLKAEGLLLVDSGGHYLDGTTDLTRTIVLGPISEEMKVHFTTVLRSNIDLAKAKFLYGCTGANLDILSREPLWKLGIDYKCGTGHGVGHILNVHEGPNSFRWRLGKENDLRGILEEGMITTDEPGVYLEGKYGIRLENELVCVKDEKNDSGQFMSFENITCVPIDLDGIDSSLMTKSEKDYLNQYHRHVYDTLKQFLTDDEKEWLKKYTRAI